MNSKHECSSSSLICHHSKFHLQWLHYSLASLPPHSTWAALNQHVKPHQRILHVLLHFSGTCQGVIWASLLFDKRKSLISVQFYRILLSHTTLFCYWHAHFYNLSPSLITEPGERKSSFCWENCHFRISRAMCVKTLVMLVLSQEMRQFTIEACKRYDFRDNFCDHA